MIENQKTKKLWLYCLIVILLTSFIIIPIVTAIVLSKPLNQEPTSTQSDQTIDKNSLNSVNRDETDANLNPTNSTEAPLCLNNHTALLTEDEALAIAMPVIEQYATENNRVIASINVTFSASVRDIYGSRTDNPTPLEPINGQSYPQWTIKASFKPTNNSPTSDNSPFHNSEISGYCVLIWADNGQIRSASVQGMCY
ncbi:MAG: hypothetical protein NWE98_04440 [Candidatus Bathyarchaeota archaeon]|nr:hypothetical protein [Candidatus Bathyarchaeota archaeon]